MRNASPKPYIQRRSLQPFHPTEDVLVIYSRVAQFSLIAVSDFASRGIRQICFTGYEAKYGIKPWARSILFPEADVKALSLEA